MADFRCRGKREPPSPQATGWSPALGGHRPFVKFQSFQRNAGREENRAVQLPSEGSDRGWTALPTAGHRSGKRGPAAWVEIPGVAVLLRAKRISAAAWRLHAAIAGGEGFIRPPGWPI
jgi:hypothetical protein